MKTYVEIKVTLFLNIFLSVFSIDLCYVMLNYNVNACEFCVEIQLHEDRKKNHLALGSDAHFFKVPVSCFALSLEAFKQKCILEGCIVVQQYILLSLRTVFACAKWFFWS